MISADRKLTIAGGSAYESQTLYCFILSQLRSCNFQPCGHSPGRNKNIGADDCANLDACDAWKSFHRDARAESWRCSRGSAMSGDDPHIAWLALYNFHVAFDPGPDRRRVERSHGQNQNRCGAATRRPHDEFAPRLLQLRRGRLPRRHQIGISFGTRRKLVISPNNN
jgi:hypothetical protein